MNRTTEMVLGILGGLIGFAGAFFALFMGEIDQATGGDNTLTGLGMSAFLFSTLGVIGGILVKFKAKLAGWVMVVSGVAILVSISLFGFIPALLLIPAGMMALLRKPQ